MNYETTEDLYWDLEEQADQLERQLLFVVSLWHARNDNFERIAGAVRVSAHELRRKAQDIKGLEDRQEMLRKIGRVLSVISFHCEYPPYVEGSGGQRPARPKGRINSVTPGGLPGMGKRR